MSFGQGYDGTATGPLPSANKLGIRKGKARPRSVTAGPALAMRSQIPGSVRHGGATGHASGRPGPYAAMPHSGKLTGGVRSGSKMQGRGFMGGPHAASPHSGKLNRATGYGKGQGKMGYNAGNPQMPTIAGASGNYGGSY